jgi:hypothetical protein
MKFKPPYSLAKNTTNKVGFWAVLLVIIVLVFSATSVGARAEHLNVLESAVPFAVSATQCIDFNQVPANNSVEGLGIVNDNLNISTSSGGTVSLHENQDPFAYRALNGSSNFGMGALGGFADTNRIHDYNFSFAPNITVSSFSVRMLDYGDYNPVGATEHDVTLVAFDIDDNVVATDSLVFTSDGHIDDTDELWLTGDSTISEGNPGNYTFTTVGSGIVRLELQYSSDIGIGATDPLHGLTVLCFEIEGDDVPDIPAGAICADFMQLAPGVSVEGLGVLHPLLNVSTSTGNAVALAEGVDPFAYRGGNGISNFGMGALGGFADSDKVHDYTFSFAPDATVSDFTLQLLDYGDYNPVGAIEHSVTAVAYNANNETVSTQTLFFESDGHINESDELWITGDSTAPLGNPGNFLFALSGNNITRVELNYSSDLGDGASDPMHGLAVLCFVPEGDTGLNLIRLRPN